MTPVGKQQWRVLSYKNDPHIKIDCYGTEGKTMDALVNIMEEFKCPLYDPQVPERYDEMSE
jgi:hypothetical protein